MPPTQTELLALARSRYLVKSVHNYHLQYKFTKTDSAGRTVLQDLSLLEWVRQQQRAGRLQREAVPACPYHEPAGVLSFALRKCTARAFCASIQQDVSCPTTPGVMPVVAKVWLQ